MPEKRAAEMVGRVALVATQEEDRVVAVVLKVILWSRTGVLVLVCRCSPGRNIQKETGIASVEDGLIHLRGSRSGDKRLGMVEDLEGHGFDPGRGRVIIVHAGPEG